MPKSFKQKEALHSQYADVFEKSNFVVVQTNNVPANVLTNMRKKLAATNSSFLVIKNNVFLKAGSKETAMKDVTFAGTLAVLEGGNDIVTALKVFENAAKDAKAALSLAGVEDAVVAKYVPFEFRMGVINHSFLNADDTVRLSKLPDKLTVISQFVGTLAAPISGVMNAMNGVSRNLVYALSDLRDKKAAEAV